jgi:hypothetical protein
VRRLTLTYKDKASGAVLHGFSQVDLDTLNKNIEINNQHLADYKKILMVFSIIMFLILMFGIWTVWYFHHYNILGNIIIALQR